MTVGSAAPSNTVSRKSGLAATLSATVAPMAGGGNGVDAGTAVTGVVTGGGNKGEELTEAEVGADAGADVAAAVEGVGDWQPAKARRTAKVGRVIFMGLCVRMKNAHRGMKSKILRQQTEKRR